MGQGTTGTLGYSTARYRNIVSFSLDGQGIIVTTGEKNRPGQVYIPSGATILGWTVDSDVACTAVIDVLRATSAEWEAGTAGTSLVGAGNKPFLTTDTSGGATVASWTPFVCMPGKVYRVTLLNGSSTTPNIRITTSATLSSPPAGFISDILNGYSYMGTLRTDLGAWTDSQTVSTAVMPNLLSLGRTELVAGHFG